MIGRLVKYDFDVLMLVHHPNDFDGRGGHAIKDNVRIDQGRSYSSSQFVAGSPQFGIADKSIACRVYCSQVIVRNSGRPAVGPGSPNEKQITPGIGRPENLLITSRIFRTFGTDGFFI